MNETKNESNSPFGHQEFLAGHLAKRKLATNGKKEAGSSTTTVARLKTPEGKPVVIQGQEYPEHGERVTVSRGSYDAGDLVLNQTVRVDRLPGANLPELNKPQTSGQAQELVNDLRQAK